MRRLWPWIAVAALILAPCLGLGVLALRVDDRPDSLVSYQQPVLTSGTVRQATGRQDARLLVSLGEPAVVVSANAAGLVTQVAPLRGQTIRTGTLVYAVDGIQRRAMVAAQPLFRDLSLNDKGPDVTALERFLKDMGLLRVTPDGRFGAATLAAVKAYQRSIGGSPTGTFTPDLVVWVPGASFVVSEVLVNAGGPAPAGGSVILRSDPKAVSAVLAHADGSAVQVAQASVIEMGGVKIGQVGPDLKVSQDAVQAVLRSTTAAGATDGGSSGAGSAEAAGSDGKGSQVAADVTLTWATKVTTTAVPTSALMTDMSGARTCVWVAATSGAGYRPVPVRVVAGTLGVSDVTANLGSAMILANPADILKDRACPSS